MEVLAGLILASLILCAGYIFGHAIGYTDAVRDVKNAGRLK